MGEEAGDQGETCARPGYWVRTRAQLERDHAWSTVLRRCRAGEFRSIIRGVYTNGPVGGLERCRAVSLWRADATFSHTTAAWLWGLIDEPESVHVTVPAGVRVGGPEWLVVHRYDLPQCGSWVFDLPVVGQARAVVESLPLLDRTVAERLVDESAQTDEQHAELFDVCHADSGRKGIALARGFVDNAVRRTASEAERVLARELARVGYRLESNKFVGRYYGDLVDDWSRVIVEVDGLGPHSERSMFRNDRRRQNRLLLDGWFVLRYAADDVFDDLQAIVAEIVSTVSSRRRARRDSPHRDY